MRKLGTWCNGYKTFFFVTDAIGNINLDMVLASHFNQWARTVFDPGNPIQPSLMLHSNLFKSYKSLAGSFEVIPKTFKRQTL